MTDRYTKLTNIIPTSNVNAKKVAHIFLEHKRANFGILSKLLTEMGSHFVSKMFLAVCSRHMVSATTTTEYQLQTTAKRSDLTP